MAGTVTTDLAFFVGATTGSSHCDSVTDWIFTGTGAADTVQFVQGTASLSTYSAASTTVRAWAFSCASTNVSGTAIYFWFALGKVAWLSAKASGGLTIRIESSATDYLQWNVAGSDTLPHNGFICHCIHTNVAADLSGGTCNKAAITKVTITANGSFPGKAYLWIDALRYGTYLAVTGTNCTLEDFITAETNVSNQWGVMSKIEGVYFAQGQIRIGLTTQSAITTFSDTNQVLIFKASIVTDTFYSITSQGAAAYATTLSFGSKSGTQGISGLFIKSASSSKRYTMSLTDTYLTTIGLYGCSFYAANTITLPSYNASKEVLNCNFSACAEVLADTCTIKYCNFISPVGRGTRIISSSFNVTDCNYISCPHGVHCNFSTSATFNALKFSGNTYDIEHSVAGTLIINCSNSSDPTTVDETGGGSTTINPLLVDVTITTKTVGGTVISDVRVLALAADGGPMPSDITVTIINSDTTATVTHTAHGMVTNDKVQIKGASLLENNSVFTITKIDADSYSYTMDSAPGSSPTGTIKATYAALSGLTDVNGQITMSRSFSSDQPITGRARKSTSTPLYRTSPIQGTIDNTSGFSAIVIMIGDE